MCAFGTFFSSIMTFFFQWKYLSKSVYFKFVVVYEQYCVHTVMMAFFVYSYSQLYFCFQSSDHCYLLNLYSYSGFIQYLSPFVNFISPVWFFFKGCLTIFLLWCKCWSTNISSEYLMIHLQLFILIVWFTHLISHFKHQNIYIFLNRLFCLF